MSDPMHLEFSKTLKKHETSIPGLVIFDLSILGDNRGWFKENWQREKMLAIGLPDFGPIQNNFSFNGKRGTMRGIHAEPWDKFISVGSGSFFGAWVDIRENSPTFGQVFTTEIDASKAIFVPAGVANSYLTLEDNTVYSYLVNDHWHPDASYSFVNATDPSLGIKWPIAPEEWEMSEKDKNHPFLKDVQPVKPKKILVTGANGQLGKALRKEFPEAEFVGREELDITSSRLDTLRRWRDYSTIINAAAYTAVDEAETNNGRKAAWKTNAEAVANLSRIASENTLTLVHVSSDYVFDGTNSVHDEDEALSPLGVYGQSKAAGDIAASTTPRHYIIRTTWVIGEGKNFIQIMKSLAERDIKPSVVSDQIGRLTFTEDLASGIKHLLVTQSPYGTYNLSNEGDASSWADIAKIVFEHSGKQETDVTPVSTEEYFKDKPTAAPRPLQSMLNLAKIKAQGFTPRDWRQALTLYLEDN
ncbi:MAG TPA: bifunctional dTDP-4-dehydrorhamnose 3,5-epimerase family protein/NAD(P)-dependent oxidoreductase [Candidatus Saccharimonadales bacterium]|nr:bifunctional dTDP-4-dehydrorhamnose 3,5-epimerase family protein/NAD(P)-dependent oxidoreductase [Candidatus Saccharimonadales bacterium]